MSDNLIHAAEDDEIVQAIVDSPANDRWTKRKIVIGLICLHLYAIFYLVAGGSFFWLFSSVPENEGTEEQRIIAAFIGFVLLVMCIGIAIVVEVITFGVHRRKYWGWIGSLVLFGLHAPLIFFPFGIVGLWAMLTGNTRRKFQQHNNVKPDYSGNH